MCHDQFWLKFYVTNTADVRLKENMMRGVEWDRKKMKMTMTQKKNSYNNNNQDCKKKQREKSLIFFTLSPI